MTSPVHEYAGWSRDEQAVAWVRALLRAVRAGDDDLAALARRELRALGLEVVADVAKVRP